MLRFDDLPEALLLVTKKFATKCKLSRYLITQTFWNTNNGGISNFIIIKFKLCSVVVTYLKLCCCLPAYNVDLYLCLRRGDQKVCN